MLKKLLMAVFVVILVAGCAGGGVNLSLDTLVFASDVTRMGDFTKLEDTNFIENQKVFVMAVVSGFASEQTGEDAWSSWPIVTLKLRNSEGKLLNTTQPFTDMVETEVEQTEFKLPSEVTISAKSGDYTIEVIVEDGITGERATGELKFKVSK
ncbi:MAG TPA: hypothetical protein PKV16_07535 [Caldisericia bacterium]|nr:hypothetical protein [Caldisericia bacterium]HPI84349.1 hypothetical protein [Caldisericia bacterium]HPQ93619.1 hypothetical protein [Caldisericia bacterium]